MEDSSGFDRVLLSLADGETSINFVGVARRAQDAFGSAHVAVETLFTAGTHPFDDLSIPGAQVSQILGNDQRVLRIADTDGAWAAVAFTTAYDGVFHIASGQPKTDKRWRKLERALVRHGQVSRCYLNHRDFLSIASELEQSQSVSVSRTTARKSGDHSSISRGFPEMRPSPQQAIAETEEQGGVLRTITMQSPAITMQLRRVAGATFYSGGPRLFQSAVLEPLAAAAANRRVLVTHRARLSVREDVRPLRVELGAQIFNDRKDTGALLDVIARMPSTSLAVFHRNPYLHFALRDERDGSNFDVVVTESNSIQIYPGYRASQDSLARVAQDLGERFGALAIEDSPQRERISVASLIG
ncbi:hypothetical protein [Microbacterium pumilum]|uniref:Uncharacterized protein n=1 Tax=Microbacterium pumilum TaxID=344165 RepID=A0ABN2S2B3_9MICO